MSACLVRSPRCCRLLLVVLIVITPSNAGCIATFWGAVEPGVHAPDTVNCLRVLEYVS